MTKVLVKLHRLSKPHVIDELFLMRVLVETFGAGVEVSMVEMDEDEKIKTSSILGQMKNGMLLRKIDKHLFLFEVLSNGTMERREDLEALVEKNRIN